MPVPTLFDPVTRTAMVTRLRRLRPDAERRWGRMTAPLMICHLNGEMRQLLGEISVRKRPSLLRHPLGRWFAVDVMPWPKGPLGTAPPEWLVAEPGSDWSTDVTRLEERLERWVARGTEAGSFDHPSFGRCDGGRMGRYLYKHWDHHFTQFGA